MFTKIQAEIMKVFASKITEKFSIKEISEAIKKPYPLIHKSVNQIIQQNFLIKDNKKLISLNYKKNISEIAYIESIRKEEFLKNKTLKIIAEDILDKINLDFFIMLIFGSAVNSKEPRDIDILIIIQDKQKISEVEKIILNVLSNFSKKFDINVISAESAYSMLSKREEINILNETLNKHILLFGAENYYRILKNARQ